MRAISLLFALQSLSSAQTPVADIMTQVAANLEKGAELRRNYVYTEKILSRLLRTNSQLAREERREYEVTPGISSTEKKLIHFTGQYRRGKQLLPYAEPSFRTKNVDIDGEIMDDFAGSLVNDKHSKDGFDKELFPFLAKDLPYYRFTLVREEIYRSRPVYRVAFESIQKKEKDFDHPWAGEALIDKEDLYPVSIQTKFAPKIPLAVRVLLGINVEQTGFSITYTRLEPGLWFPATYGTEMRLEVLFGYKRIITLSLEAANFRRASTDSAITFHTER